jgi:glycosyltransferase involved in cell wall biosynthesis
VRILHTIATLDTRAGGPAVALAGLAAAQVAAGLEVSIAATVMAGEGPGSAADLGARGIGVTTVGPDLAARFDFVHIHGVWDAICRQTVSAARGVPYVIAPHGMLTPWSLGQKAWKKRLYMALRLRRDLQRAAAIHYMTDCEREGSARLELNARAIVEPIGIDLAEFENLPPPGSFRSRYDRLADAPLVLFLGRIHPGKGLEYLVPAIAQLGIPNAMLAVVGPDSGGYRAVIEKEVHRHRLDDRVVFTGSLRGIDRIAALADADVFCLPSDHENFGLAVIESLAAGTPAVISRDVAISREVTAAKAGVAVERDPVEIARELTRFLADRPYRDAAAQRCRPFVWNSFDWRNIATRWVEHYRVLVEGCKSNQP